jgi:biotin transport system substrate-specific component
MNIQESKGLLNGETDDVPQSVQYNTENSNPLNKAAGNLSYFIKDDVENPNPPIVKTGDTYPVPAYNPESNPPVKETELLNKATNDISYPIRYDAENPGLPVGETNDASYPVKYDAENSGLPVGETDDASYPVKYDAENPGLPVGETDDISYPVKYDAENPGLPVGETNDASYPVKYDAENPGLPVGETGDASCSISEDAKRPDAHDGAVSERVSNARKLAIGNLRRPTAKLALTALFTALIIAGTFIRFQLFMIPLTMQSVFVTLTGYLLGKKYGALAAAVYVLMGLIGIPVFTAGGGFQYVVHPTFGYILGFILSAFLTGFLTEKLEKEGDSRIKRYIKLAAAGLIGMLASYAVGLPYFFIIARYYLQSAALTDSVILMSGFVNTIGKDVVFTLLAALLVLRIRPIAAKYIN